MKSFEDCAYLKNMSFSLILTIALLFVPLNVVAKDIPKSISKTSLTDSKVTTTSQPNLTTTSPLSTSTENEKRELCPVSFIFEGDQHQQNLLKEFRDEVLARHKQGINYTRLYYIHSPEITLILLSHNDIKIHAQKILKELLPVTTDLLNRGTAAMSQQLIDDIDALLNEIAHQASSQLREAIRMAKSDIIKKEIFKEMGIKITKQNFFPFSSPLSLNTLISNH